MAERPITQIPIDQSYASTEGLYKQFLSDENKGLGRQRTVEQVFEDDFEKAFTQAKQITKGLDLPVTAMGVIIEMIFQLGIGGRSSQ